MLDPPVAKFSAKPTKGRIPLRVTFNGDPSRDPDGDNDFDSQRRLMFGGAHWSEVGRGKLGIVITLDQSVQTSNSELLGRRLSVQTQVAF